MVDLTFAAPALERILKAGLDINNAVQMVQQNKKECLQIKRYVAKIRPLLLLLQETGLLRHPAISDPLEDLAESLEEAVKLITECQEANAVLRFLTAGHMAKQLQRVQYNIQRKLELSYFAGIVDIRITLRTICELVSHLPGSDGHMEILSSSPSTMGGARSGVNSEITMVATGNAPALSGLYTTTMQQFSELAVNGDSHSIELQVKIVIKVDIMSKRSQEYILSTVSKIRGFISADLNRENSTLAVVGNHLDHVTILRHLRMAGEPAVLLTVEKASALEAQRTMVSAEEAEQEPTTRWPRARVRGIRAITAKLSRFIPWASPRRRAMVELDTSPAAGGTHGPLLLQHQPVAPPSATPPPPVRRTFFDLSRLRRRVRVPAVRQLRMKQQRARLDGSSRPSSRARVSPLFASCLTLCALLLLASLWALR